MQPPIAIPDPAHPTFTAVNEAKTFDPFDLTALHWTSSASPAQREAALAKFGLRLTCTAAQATALFAPAKGTMSWSSTTNGGQFVSRTLVLELDADALRTLHLAGRVEDDPEPATVSAIPWLTISGTTLRVRLLFTFTTTALDQRVRAQMVALKAAGTLTRDYDENFDLRIQNGVLTLVELPAGTEEQRHFEPWWSGLSAATWRLRGTDPNNKIVDLQRNEVVHIQAQMSDGLAKSATEHWYLCNAGLILRSLGVAGDPADPANDVAYRAVCGDCFTPIVTGGTLASGGTNPAADTPLTFADVLAVHGGSNGGVLLQPPTDRIAPGCAFSFTSAEDVTVFSPRLENQVVGLRLWQPTYDLLDLETVRNRVVAGKGNGSDVWVPTDGTVIVTTEYYAPGRATRYPSNRDTVFLPAMEAAFGYDGSRARPADGQPPHGLSAANTWERAFNLNEIAEVRPEHPRWRTKSAGQTFPTVRRLFPLRVDVRLGAAVDAPLLCTLSQDEVDCIRQEYVFHMQFTDYYQDYTNVWSRASDRATRIFRSPTHRITVDGGNQPVPAIGQDRAITVPPRRIVRPIVTTATRYRYTLLIASWRDKVQQAEAAGEVYAARLRDILGDAAALADIRDAIAAGFDYPDPVLPALPSYAAELAVMVVDLLGVSSPAGSKEDFLAAQLRSTDAINRFTALNPLRLQLGSAWRPPEYNELPSITPISNHQIGEAFDKQPLGSGEGVRNPLAQLCLHIVGQELFATSLREMLLENQAAAYLSFLVDTEVDANGKARRRYVVIANFDTNSSGGIPAARAGRHRGGAADPVGARWRGDHDRHAPALEPPGANLSGRVRQAHEHHWRVAGAAPTCLEVYLFGLTVASHVHFTWNL